MAETRRLWPHGTNRPQWSALEHSQRLSKASIETSDVDMVRCMARRVIFNDQKRAIGVEVERQGKIDYCRSSCLAPVQSTA